MLAADLGQADRRREREVALDVGADVRMRVARVADRIRAGQRDEALGRVKLGVQRAVARAVRRHEARAEDVEAVAAARHFHGASGQLGACLLCRRAPGRAVPRAVDVEEPERIVLGEYEAHTATRSERPSPPGRLADVEASTIASPRY